MGRIRPLGDCTAEPVGGGRSGARRSRAARWVVTLVAGLVASGIGASQAHPLPAATSTSHPPPVSSTPSKPPPPPPEPSEAPPPDEPQQESGTGGSSSSGQRKRLPAAGEPTEQPEPSPTGTAPWQASGPEPLASEVSPAAQPAQAPGVQPDSSPNALHWWFWILAFFLLVLAIGFIPAILRLGMGKWPSFGFTRSHSAPPTPPADQNDFGQ